MITRRPSNRIILRRGAAYRQARLSELEHEVTSLRYFSPVVLPGLLQTAEYMRRVFSLELSGTETEAALRWALCPAEVMAAQASHISSLATLTNVRIGLISLGAPVDEIPLHGYQILDDRLARIELEHAVVTVTDPHDVATYVRLFGTMSQAAEFGQEARSRLASIAASLNCSH